MDFLKAFEDIDEDTSGEITSEELTVYMKKQNYDDKFVNKWLALFDQDNSGTITIEEYCDTLGLIPKKEYMERVASTRQETAPTTTTTTVTKSVVGGEGMDGVRVITLDKDMSEEYQLYLVRLAREGQSQFDLEREIAKYMKTALDERYERAWQVVVGRFQYGSFVTHEVGCMFHFWVGRFAFLVWKTPDY